MSKTSVEYERLSIWEEVPEPIHHPLTYDSAKEHTTNYALMKTILLAPLALIRIILLLICVLLLALFANLSIIGADMSRPLPLWRRIIKYPIHLFGRGVMLAWGYWWINTKGTPAKANEAPIIVGNHTSFIEPIFLGSTFLCFGVSRIENASIPIVGGIFRCFQMIFVDRKNPQARRDTSEAIVNRTRTNIPEGFTIPEGPTILSPMMSPTHSGANSPARGNFVMKEEDKADLKHIFPKKDKGFFDFLFEEKYPQLGLMPEGTCTNGKVLVQFKVGAFAPGLPVQPVLCTFPYKHLDVSWVNGGPDMGAIFKMMICQFVNYMEVEFLPVYVPSREEQLNPKLFANNVKKVMAKALKIPMSEHSFEDVQLTAEAQKYKIPVEPINVELYKLTKRMGITLSVTFKFIKIFAEFGGAKNGYLERLDFNKMCSDPKLGDALFKEFDSKGRGRVSFREFLVCGAIINKICGKDADNMLAKLLYNVLLHNHEVSLANKKEVDIQLSTLGVSEENRKAFAGLIGADKLVLTRDVFVAAMSDSKCAGLLNEIPSLLKLYVENTPATTESAD